MCQNTTMRLNGAWIKRYCVYAQKHITPCTVVITSLLVRDKPLEAPPSVKGIIVYCWNHMSSRPPELLMLVRCLYDYISSMLIFNVFFNVLMIHQDTIDVIFISCHLQDQATLTVTVSNVNDNTPSCSPLVDAVDQAEGDCMSPGHQQLLHWLCSVNREDLN